MSKSKTYEALLVISTAFMILYLFGFIRHGESKEIFIYLACGVGFIGIFLKPLGKVIASGWYKLAELLNFIMSKLIMGLVYTLILVPIALLFRLTKKDRFGLRRAQTSKWINREHRYGSDDLKNIW